jgi:hypothetical protein
MFPSVAAHSCRCTPQALEEAEEAQERAAVELAVERAQVEHRAARAEAACAEAAGRLRATIVEVAEARDELQVGRCGGWGFGPGVGQGSVQAIPDSVQLI